MSLIVLFSLQAQRMLLRRRSRTNTSESQADIAMNEITTALQTAFPGMTVAIVQDIYGSYSVRDGEYILQVEVSHNGRTEGVYVVKVNDREPELKREIEAWESCRPPGLRHDLVLANLEARQNAVGQIVCLVYEDAGQIIGVDKTLTLEEAMLQCVRFGVPTPDSIGECLFLLYERLGLLLYPNNAGTAGPTDYQSLKENDRLNHNREEIFRLWADASARVIRSIALTAGESPGLNDAFMPPLELLRPMFIGPTITLPLLRRGHSHGDLHGRNVLVGQVGDRVLWPIVYDYADMGRNNLIGWDFVKMETELKIRAYPHIFTANPLVVAQSVLRTERDLHAETERCREGGQWPAAPQYDTPLERLKWLVLTIRKHSANHLGIYCNRSREWLAEYYFLLAFYSLQGIRFPNLTDQQRQFAYIAAGAASARYDYAFK